MGLAGGWGQPEVTLSTTRLMPCAEFAPARVRKSATRHTRKTDASHRFERGVDSAGLEFALRRLAHLVTQLAGGKIQGATSVRIPGWTLSQALVEIDPAYFENFLGMPVSAEQAERILQGLECEVDSSTLPWRVRAPSYRRDLKLREDFAEEIARTLGYDQIRETVPHLTTLPISVFATGASARLALIDRAKDACAALGLHETLNYAFTSKEWLAKFGLVSGAKLINPLSEELGYLVPSLLPGLVRNALDNGNNHFGSALALRLFEIRRVHVRTGAYGPRVKWTRAPRRVGVCRFSSQVEIPRRTRSSKRM